MNEERKRVVTARRQRLAKLDERQQAEFCELVDRHGYHLDEAFAVAKKVGARIAFRREAP